MAKVVGVADVPDMPGAGLLHFDDGRPPLLALPEVADEHRERLGLNALDNGVAGPGSGTPDPVVNPMAGVPNFGAAAPGVAAPPAIALPSAGLPGAPLAQPQGIVGVPPGIAAAPPLPGAGAIPKAIDPTEEAHQAQQDRLNNIIRTGMVPGSQTGYSPAHWQADTRKVVTERGADYDPEAARLRSQAGQAVLDAQLNQAATLKNQTDEEAARSAHANMVAQNQAAALSAQMVQRQQNFQRQETAMQNDLQTYAKNGAPDPTHYFKQQGTFSNILSAIAQGLGAAGASLGHTQNFATQITQDAINRDVAAQEKAYNEGLQTRNGALNRFVDFYHGDMDMARSALTQAQLKIAQTDTERFAATAQSQNTVAAAKTMAAQFQQAQLLEEQKRQELAAGKSTITSEDKFHPASGGAGSGRRLTLEQELALAKAQEDAKGKSKDQGALGLTPQALARQKANFGTKNEQLTRTVSALAHEAELQGVKLDPTTGTIVDPKTGKPATAVDVPVGAGLVGSKLPSATVGADATALRRARENSARLHAEVVYGHSVSADEAADEVKHQMGQTDAEVLESMQRRARELFDLERDQDATAALIDPRIVNQYNAAKKNVNYARATGTPLAGPTPQMGTPNSGGESESDGDSGN